MTRISGMVVLDNFVNGHKSCLWLKVNIQRTQHIKYKFIFVVNIWACLLWQQFQTCKLQYQLFYLPWSQPLSSQWYEFIYMHFCVPHLIHTTCNNISGYQSVRHCRDVTIYRRHGKICWAKCVRFQHLQSFRGNTFVLPWPKVLII